MADTLTIKSIVSDSRITAQFSDTHLPRYARNGEMFVVDGILYIYTDLDDTGHGRWFPLTNEKEVYTFEQAESVLRWIIPIEFHTNNIQVVVYDEHDKIYKDSFTVDIDNMEITLTFENPTAGQVYIIINKSFDWVDERFIVADKKFAITPNELDPNQYFLEIDTAYFEMLKNGDVTFRKSLLVEGSMNITGEITLDGETTLNGDVAISDALVVGGSVDIANNLTTELNAHIKGDLQVDTDAIIEGNLTVRGTTTTVDSEQLKIADNIITLNSSATGSPTENAGLEVLRGDLGVTTVIQWDETDDVTNIPNNTTINGTLQVDGHTNIDGNLTIQGNEVKISTGTLTVEDNIITVSHGHIGAPVDDAGIDIDRGDEGILPLIIWNETIDKVTVPVVQSDGSILQEPVIGKGYLDAEIDKEESRAINVETIITNRVSALETVVTENITDFQSQINTEKTARINNDAALQTSIDNEVTRAVAAEDTLRNDLDTEIADREAVGAYLQTQVTDEIAQRIAGDAGVQFNVNAEKSRAEAAESALQTGLNNEITRATTFEGDLSTLTTVNKVSLVGALNEEVARAKSAEGDLETNLTAEVNTRTSADTTLQNNIDTEANTRTTAVNTLQGNIDSEATARVNGDAFLQTGLTNEITRATEAETTLTTKVDACVSGDVLTPQEVNSDLTVNESVVIKKNLTVEGVTTTVNSSTTEVDDNKIILNSSVTIGAPALDATMTVRRGDEGENNIIRWYENGDLSVVQVSEWDIDTTQFVDRTVATQHYVDVGLNTINNALDTRVTTLEDDTTVPTLVSDLSDEIARAKAVEGDRTSLITTVTTDIVSAINSEVTRAKDAETLLTTNLTNEINRSIAKDNDLDLLLTNETTRAILADEALNNDITNEVTRAKAIEGDITTLTTTDKTSLTNSINSLKTVVDDNLTTNNDTLSAMFTKTNDDIIFKGNLVPATNSNLNIGSVTNKIGEIHVSANTIYLGDNTVISELGLQLNGELNTTSLNAISITAENLYDKTTVDTKLSGVESELTTAITTLETAHNALVDVVSTESLSKSVTEAQSVSSDVSFANTVTVQGTLNVIGSQVSTNIEDLHIENNEIIMNDTIGDLVPFLDAKISVDRGLEGIQPILIWKELGDNSAVMIPYIDGNGDVIEDQVVTTNALNSVITSTNSDLITSVTDEIARANTAEQLLDTKIVNEIARATTTEGILSGLSTKLQDINGGVPPNLVTAINREVTRASVEESNITSNLNNDIIRTTSLFEVQEAAINAEVARAGNKEEAIETALETEVTRAKESESTISASLVAEQTRAQLKENEISLGLTTEVARATVIENTLQTQLNTLTATMSTDVERLAAIQNVTNAFESVDADLTAAITALSNASSSGLEEEIIRASGAEAINSVNINNEIARAKAVEGPLISLATVEQTNLVLSINEVHNDVDTEVARALDAESVLQGNIDSVNSSSDNNLATKLSLTGGTMTGDVIFEDQKSLNMGVGETSLSLLTNGSTSTILKSGAAGTITISSENKLWLSNSLYGPLVKCDQNNTEILHQGSSRILTTSDGITVSGNVSTNGNIDGRDVAADGAKLDAILSSSVADKDSFAEIVSLINSVDTENDEAFGTYVTNNNARSTTIESNLTSETIRATLAEDTLTNALNDEINRAKVTEGMLSSLDTASKTNLVSAINETHTDIDNEISRATNAEDTLTNNLNSEISRAVDSETTLQNNIDNETTRASLSESELTNNLNSEIARALDSETALTSRLNTVEAAASGTTTGIQLDLDNEVIRATNAEGVLTNNLNIEIARAIDAETTLQSNIDAEVALLDTDVADINTALDTKLPLAGGTMTGNVIVDNLKSVTFSSATDNLSILNDGNTAYIDKNGTGFLRIRTNDQLAITDSGDIPFLQADTSTNDIKLYQAGNEKLSTTSTGVDVTGNVTISGTVDGRDIASDGAKLDAILNLAPADKDSFAEIVDLVNSVDTTNDSAFASYVLSNDAALESIVDGSTPAVKANTLTNPRTISLSGDASGSVSFDGSSDVTITTTVADDSHTHDTRYYTETEIDTKLTDGTVTKMAAQSNIGEAINFFQNDGGGNLGIRFNSTAHPVTSVEDGAAWEFRFNNDNPEGDFIISRSLNITSPGDAITWEESFKLEGSDTEGYLYGNRIWHTANFNPADYQPVGSYVTTDSSQAIHATDAISLSGKTLSIHKGDGTAETLDLSPVNDWRPVSSSVTSISGTDCASSFAVKTAYEVGNHDHPYASTFGDASKHFNGDIITASSSMRAPIFYDSDNTMYYIDLANEGTSINCAGKIVSAGDVTAFSDRTLKDNIRPIDNALSKVLEINGVTFTRNDMDDKTTRYTGVIAQEVEEVLPEAVSTNDEGVKSVAYGNMVGMLIEAMKEQQTQINELKDEINQLKGK